VNKKFDVTLDLVEGLVRDQFPAWAALPIKPVEFGGWDNKTFHLGEDMSVRLPSAASYAAQVSKEQEWLPKLAPHLSLPIPVPLAMGRPSRGYPWHWSVYKWIEGETAAKNRIRDLNEFAEDLAYFLVELQSIDSAAAPIPGDHNFYRGGSLTVYDAETRNTVKKLEGQIETDLVIAVWEEALLTTWEEPPVWLHGDVYPTNLLLRDGRLSAVIDFGCAAVGDPACDLIIAWSFLDSQSRRVFQRTLGPDEATLARARGWGLWKALLEAERNQNVDSFEGRNAYRTIKAILSEYLANST
jgi:aminoglycoside phosphotransferase (APT) family kinase protein